MSGNYPAGVTDADPHFDLPSVHDNEEEFDEETMCGVLVDLDSRCGKPIARIAIEPYTPGHFKTECCEDCWGSFVSGGYIDGGKINSKEQS